MGYRILERSTIDKRHVPFTHKEYATRESAKRAYERFYTGKYKKYKKFVASMKIVKTKSNRPTDMFGGAFKYWQ